MTQQDRPETISQLWNEALHNALFVGGLRLITDLIVSTILAFSVLKPVQTSLRTLPLRSRDGRIVLGLTLLVLTTGIYAFACLVTAWTGFSTVLSG